MTRPKPKAWRCYECGATGDDGEAGWTRHWILNHQDPGF